MSGWPSLFEWAFIVDHLLLAFKREYCLKFIRIKDEVAMANASVLVTSQKDY